MDINVLRDKISKANKAYRLGKPFLSDYEYDLLIDTLTEVSPHDPILSQIGFIDGNDERMEDLPVEMNSMNKVKTVEELKKWMVSKGIPEDTALIETPKYDGASLCVKEAQRRAWTRGNGIQGQRSDEHLKVLTNGATPKVPDTLISFGEAICSKKAFKKHEDVFVNPRNMISGKLNAGFGSKGWSEEVLGDSEYIRYGLNLETADKDKQLEICNKLNCVKVPYKIVTLKDVTADTMKALFDEWGKDYTLDGIIIEVNDAKLRQSLGRETGSGNPCYARAYKGNFEEIKETTVVEVEWNVSKQGYLKPVGIVEPVSLDGATVTRITLFNAAYVQNMKIHKGVKILCKRSGGVIPYIIKVL